MNTQGRISTEDVEIADSWAVSVTDQLERSRRTAWIVAAIAAVIALLLAIALVILLPLKTVEPYTLLVDRETGYVEELAPLERQVIAPDAALTRSFLVQYVIARESFDIDNLSEDYRKVTLWSAGDARQAYMAGVQVSNPLSPLATYPRRTLVRVEVRSVSSLGADRSLVRFSTIRQDPGAQPMPPMHWAAIVFYRYTGAEMSAADRMLNPLGFQVNRYRKDAETLPEEFVPASAVATPVSPAPVEVTP